MSTANHLSRLTPLLTDSGGHQLFQFFNDVDADTAARFRTWLGTTSDTELSAIADLLNNSLTRTEFASWWKLRDKADSIGALFKNGQSIDDVARALRGTGGADLARSFEPIRLVERDGLLWTLDNRRLAAFSAGGQQVPFAMATEAEINAEWARKFTTTAQQGWGQFITVRPPPGFTP